MTEAIQEQIATLLRQSMGLDAASIGDTALQRAVRQRMRACALVDSAVYWQRLQAEKAELQELIETVIVPETWFFRDPGAFQALNQIAREEWLPSHPAGKMRILSIPCSSGEEPYSISMSLLDGGLLQDRFLIDAVDISRQSLEKARRGVYRSNSFRIDDESYCERYFHPTPAGHRLAEMVREPVRFQQGNILTMRHELATEIYDIVFCRNVLIYFDAVTQQAVINDLIALLRSTGVLFVGPAEAALLPGDRLTSAGFQRAFAFRKVATSATIARRPPASRATGSRGRSKAGEKTVGKPLKSSMPLSSLLERKQSAGVPKRSTEAPKAPPATSGTTSRGEGGTREEKAREEKAYDLEAANRLANAGKVEEAIKLCESHIEKWGPSPEAYYLLGVLRDMQNDPQAAACYRKVLFLDADNVAAMTHLALLLKKEGKEAVAQQLMARAQRVEERSRQ